ncbi:hypothetical protein [Fodinicola acaciae]|uniref:hypothetical protein n=1 Tax=Fodinicola acaciae TaxID=2681555 RepID=UPI0013D1CCA1|nr:hypothetical protein [Fodinicola acaciae]
MTSSPLDAPIAESPNSADELDRLLIDHLRLAIERQSVDGSFDVDGRELDVGDNTLGVVSLLAYGWHRFGDQSYVEPARRGLAFHLARRVFRTDNPGTPYLRVGGSGEAHARYTLTPGRIPGGDWPTTVWALLHVVNVLRFGDGLATAAEREALVDLGRSYWRWCTEITAFDPQDASNQAIACVIAGHQLGALTDDAEMKRAAKELYATKIRPTRATDRGYTYFQEHSGGFDQNYGAIALTFVTEAYLVTGDETFFEDAKEHARYLNLRMSVSGFDYGGARHNEERDNSPSVLGLRYWSNALGDDLGRYLTDSRRAFHMDTADGVPTGHFAFTTIWLMEHRQDWWPIGREENTRFKLRKGNVSIVFDESLTPYLVSIGRTEIIRTTTAIPAAASMELNRGPYAIKLVGPRAYICDGASLVIVSTVDAPLPLGLPYLSAGRKVTSVTVDGVELDLGEAGRSLEGSIVRAGELEIRGRIRVTNAAAGMDYFNSAASRDLLMEPYSLTVSTVFDPWGVPNPQAGWDAMRGTTTFEALPDADGMVVVRFSGAGGERA